jgi:hypothetical protein
MGERGTAHRPINRELPGFDLAWYSLVQFILMTVLDSASKSSVPHGFGLRLLLASCLLVMAAHVVLGADPVVVCLAMLTVAAGIGAALYVGFLNTAALLISLVVFRYIGFPLIGKLLFLQPLDSNLGQPLGSVASILLGVSAFLFGLIPVAKINFKRAVLVPTSDHRQLNRISVLAMAVGCVANLGVALHAGREYTGITMANFFVPFLHLALISAIAAELCKSGRRRSWNFWVLSIVLVEVVFAMVRNSRMSIVEILLCYIVTLSAFQGKIKWRRIGLTGLAAMFLVVAATPVMLYVRAMRSNLTWTQRITATLEAVADWRTALAHFQAIERFQEGHGFYLNYYGSPQNILERVSLINHVDVMKCATDRHGPVGGEDLRIAFARSLPRIVMPDKPVGFSHGGWLNCRANIECVEGSFATVPLIANGYAAFGWAGVMVYPFLFGSAVLLLMRVVSGLDLNGNVWAIYLLIRFQNMFVEGDAAAFFQVIIRDFPQDVVVMIAIAWISCTLFQGSAAQDHSQ